MHRRFDSHVGERAAQDAAWEPEIRLGADYAVPAWLGAHLVEWPESVVGEYVDALDRIREVWVSMLHI